MSVHFTKAAKAQRSFMKKKTTQLRNEYYRFRWGDGPLEMLIRRGHFSILAFKPADWDIPEGYRARRTWQVSKADLVRLEGEKRAE